MPEEKNFFTGLFDFSFHQSLLRRLVKLLYVIGIIGGGIFVVARVVLGYQQSPADALINLVAGIDRVPAWLRCLLQAAGPNPLPCPGSSPVQHRSWPALAGRGKSKVRGGPALRAAARWLAPIFRLQNSSSRDHRAGPLSVAIAAAAIFAGTHLRRQLPAPSRTWRKILASWRASDRTIPRSVC